MRRTSKRRLGYRLILLGVGLSTGLTCYLAGRLVVAIAGLRGITLLTFVALATVSGGLTLFALGLKRQSSAESPPRFK